MIDCFRNKATGYTDDRGGYSGTFSWFRLPHSPLFVVYGHAHGFVNFRSEAVTDDFGNLMAVKS